MKKMGIISSQLAATLAGLRHTDIIVISDSGLPAPVGGSEIVDLGVVYGVPSFETVVRAVLEEIVVEASLVAAEIREANAPCWELLQSLLASAPPLLIPHEDFKRQVATARCVVRTGEATPYANVLLRCGVPF